MNENVFTKIARNIVIALCKLLDIYTSIGERGKSKGTGDSAERYLSATTSKKVLGLIIITSIVFLINYFWN